jgi:asparagine synthase (glutamine-hydrolysing)
MTEWQPHYIGLVWGQRTAEPSLAASIRSTIADRLDRFQLVFEGKGIVLFANPANPQLRVHAAGNGSLVAIGSLFSRSEGAAVAAILDVETTTGNAADRLFQELWGSYVAFASEDNGSTSIIRDPSGGIPVHVVDAGGLAVVTDSLPGWLVDTIGRPLPVDKHLLANALAMPLLTTHRSLLRNVAQIPAGGVLSWQARFGTCRPAWKPFARAEPAEDRAGALRSAVLATAQAWGRVHRRVLVELSGGLDSAIVLGALGRNPEGLKVACINLTTQYRGGDERTTARAAAERWSVELVEMTAREEDLDYRLSLAGPQPVQPLLYGLDAVLEAAVSGVAEAFDVSAIMTGQGGDAVFFQMPSDKVAIDCARADGFKAMFSAAALDAARRTRTSIWRVQWHMLKDRISGTRPERMPLNVNQLGPAALEMIDPPLTDHPWLAIEPDLPPGKQLQLMAVANGQLFNGPALRGQRFALFHPLLSQPVVEACLAIPTYELSYGTQDRALARTVFGDLLPTSIARRRGKGETSVYYRRAIVENLGFLKPHLLDGTLVEHGLLDREALSLLMEDEALVRSEEAHLITILASFESWARHWGL